MPTQNTVILLFVEDGSDKAFYNALLSFYRDRIGRRLKATYEVIDMKGVGRYEQKFPNQLKNKWLPKYRDKNIIVFCCYDTDVFSFSEKLPVDWPTVRKKAQEIGIRQLYEIRAEKMIEDWFLLDPDGLCRFLGIKRPTRLLGKDGYEKMKALFKKGNKAYLKGNHEFIPHLNIATIRDSIQSELQTLEDKLGVRLK